MRRVLCSAALVAVSVSAFTGCRGGESAEPPVHLIPNMDTQEKGRPYRKDTSGLFGDGRVMQPPVEGTVAQGQLFEDEVLHEGIAAGGEAAGVDGGIPSGSDGGSPAQGGGTPPSEPTKKFPASIKLDDALRQRGEIRYQIYCSPCHGREGDGKGPVAGRGLQVPPPSFHDARLKEMTVGQMYSAIKNGVNNYNMPSYAAQIPVEDRWAIIAAVRKMQRDRDPAVQDEGGEAVKAVVATSVSVDVGAQLYKSKGCNACHTLDGNRLVGPTFKGLHGKTEGTSAGDVTVDDAYLKESIVEPAAKIVNTYPPAMPKLTFTDIEVDSLILFIKAQK